MNINGIELKKIWCHKCGHEWISKLECPKKCPKCHRYDPWLAKPEKEEKELAIIKIRKYPIQHLQVGESTVLPWVHLPNGQPDTKAGDSMNRCVRQEAQRKGKKFETMPTSAGLNVRRIG